MFMPDHPTARALLAFRAAHGRRWKAKLLFLWSTGRDVEEANGACLRQLRNQAARHGSASCRHAAGARSRDWRSPAIDRPPRSSLIARASFTKGTLWSHRCSCSALHLLAISCELGLKAYLMSRGWSHDGSRAIFVTTSSPPSTKRGGLASVPGPYSRRFAYKPRSRLCRASYRRAGGGWLCCDFAAVLRAMGSLLDAVAAGLSLPMPTP
jgi:hypothetical protein